MVISEPAPTGAVPPALAVRWSEHEARKPYARPFAVTFHDGAGRPLGGITASGHDLLYYSQFQGAVITLAGELFREPSVEAAEDPQRAWLDVLTPLLPAAPDLVLIPESEFDPREGRVFHARLGWEECTWTRFGAGSLLEYQEFQAALAHQTGRLHRHAVIEGITDPDRRRRRWIEELAGMLRRPGAAEAMAESWPWR